MNNITNKEASFKTTSHSLSCSLYPYLKLDGFGENGITWEDTEKTTFRQGADGKTVKVSKPVLYTCTMEFMPNASCRNQLDNIYLLTTPQFGKKLTNNEIVYTEKNELTGTITTYMGGDIVSTQSGNTNTLNDGQANKTYKFTFSKKVILPL